MWLKTALVVSIAIVGHGQAPERSAPLAEFERLVHCGPGWRLVVYQSGDAHQRVEDTCVQLRSYSRRYRFDTKQLDALQAAILKARFQDLPAEIYPDTVVPDENAFVITVWKGGTAKRVLARGLERSTFDEAQRFQMVWDAMASVVPDPTLSHERK